MSELENGYIDDAQEPVEEIETEEAETEEVEPSDLATDSDAEYEEQPQTDEKRVNQEKINAVINEKHRKMREAQEENERLRQQLQQYTYQQQQQAPSIPSMPDPFEDGYEDKLKQRDESIRRRAQWEAEQQVLQQYQAQVQQDAQRRQLEQLQQQAQSYSERAKSYGITPQELQVAASNVAQAGLSDDLALAILNDEDGPLFTKYLAANPLEAYEIASMPIAQAALHLERVIRPKAKSLKPKQTSAPKPGTRTKQTVGNAELGAYKHLSKGAKFE